jgi:predicted nucleic acid-binding protein
MATAQYHGFTIVTRNEKDFTPAPRVCKPWAL